MTRLIDAPNSTMLNRLVRRYSRRVYGDELAPGLVAGHNPRVLLAWAVFERLVAGWRSAPERLRTLAVMGAAHRIGCAWCTDFGYWQARSSGMDEATLRDMPHWRDSDRFDALDRIVLEIAEQMSGDPDEGVQEHPVRELVERLGEAAAVEVVTLVAVENQRSRFNTAFGLTSQGFAQRCSVT